ncbi:MAG: hypothetical protein K2J27_06040 [Duncaniella sp.]|nr:hypothetical protein [Duncaniella sp.]
MTYEEEQLKYAEELKRVTKELENLEELFSDPGQTDAKISMLYRELIPVDLELIYSEFKVQQQINLFKQNLEYKYYEKKFRKIELEELLSQSPADRAKYNVKRNIGKSLKFAASITPQHVSGRVYRVENGDGCGTFCLWFLIIDAIIAFIIILATK